MSPRITCVDYHEYLMSIVDLLYYSYDWDFNVYTVDSCIDA
jgi:hypothetical protein